MTKEEIQKLEDFLVSKEFYDSGYYRTSTYCILHNVIVNGALKPLDSCQEVLACYLARNVVKNSILYLLIDINNKNVTEDFVKEALSRAYEVAEFLYKDTGVDIGMFLPKDYTFIEDKTASTNKNIIVILKYESQPSFTLQEKNSDDLHTTPAFVFFRIFREMIISKKLLTWEYYIHYLGLSEKPIEKRLALIKKGLSFIYKVFNKEHEQYLKNNGDPSILERFKNTPSLYRRGYLLSSFSHFNYFSVFDVMSDNLLVAENKYKIKVLSRHPSHKSLRGEKFPKRVLIRFGSQTEVDENRFEIVLNRTGAVANSASKFLMKELFTRENVKTAEWIIPKAEEELIEWITKVDKQVFITKSQYGSRGTGLTLHNSPEELISYMQTRYNKYLVEVYYPYVREYRLHVSKNGCFYSCRKMLRSDVPADKRWFRNDSNSVWIVEENPLFDKPSNWDIIVQECVKALKATGLDLGACDVRVQSSKKSNPDFIICEINSAPSFGEKTLEHYKKEIRKLCAD